MSFLIKSRWFQKSFIAIFVLFMGMFILVVITAYSRRSGNTGLDMAKIQFLRSPASQETPSP